MVLLRLRTCILIFSNITVDTSYSHTKEVKYTSPSCIGMSMLGGALMDGPAAAPLAVKFGKKAARVIKRHELAKSKRKKDVWATKIMKKYQTQGAKDIVLETGERKILGTHNIKHLILPGAADETIKTFKYQHRVDATR